VRCLFWLTAWPIRRGHRARGRLLKQPHLNLAATPESDPINFPIHIWSRTTLNSPFLFQPPPFNKQVCVRPSCVVRPACLSGDLSIDATSAGLQARIALPRLFFHRSPQSNASRLNASATIRIRNAEFLLEAQGQRWPVEGQEGRTACCNQRRSPETEVGGCMDAQDRRSAGDTRASQRLHNRIESTRYDYDRYLAAVRSAGSHSSLFSVLHKLISVSNSVGHPVSPPPIPTDLRS
jgi:hypothetical protein